MDPHGTSWEDETRTASEFQIGPFRHAVRISENRIYFHYKFLTQVFTNKKKRFEYDEESKGH